LHEVWSNPPPRKARLTLDERRTQALLGRRARKRAEPGGTGAKSTDKAAKRALPRAS
jgi:hypothetical protein